MNQSTENDIHAYIDGQMNATERVRFEQAMRRDPELAARVSAWQRDAQQLRAAFAGTPDDVVPAKLDPSSIRRAQRSRHRARLAVAASLVLSLLVGGSLGWQMRAMQGPAEAPMADALQAYRMFATATPMRADVETAQSGQMQHWLGQQFGHQVQLPSLKKAGFTPVSGRLMATAVGPAALVVYRNAQGDAISFYVRPPNGERGPLPRGEHREGNLLAQYWSGGGYNYAMVSRADSRDVAVARQAVPSA
ncbi:anti-sigma factor [Oleiagrimonas sp. C23AA]|uniref:anti-sigma factor family protein n=1 Tax=Oleiagrimonas sp. C23AA TaxID=2719047 RepID=UPI00141FE31D|nr:anti-sigma factor [Oleiagrimonas sp. C23AA]NII09261.1 anti-sigma factor [Oleiagrimonas sp. C23AA]